MISVAPHQLIPVMFAWNGRSKSMYHAEIAEAVCRASAFDPIFPGELGPAATACILLAEAFEASTFTPYMIRGRRFGVLQVPMPTEPKKSVTEIILSRANALYAVDLIRESFLRTQSLPWHGRLAWFLDLGEKAGSTYEHHDYKGGARTSERSHRSLKRATQMFHDLFDKKRTTPIVTLAPKLRQASP